MSWPDVPSPWALKPYYTQRYREGYRTAYKDQAARVFSDPRTQGAKAYFEGFNAGTIARTMGVFHEQAIKIPEQFSSGFARNAYRKGYKLAQETMKQQIPILEWIESYSKHRAEAANNTTWNSGTAFDAGWRDGACALGILSPPLPNEKPTKIPQ